MPGEKFAPQIGRLLLGMTTPLDGTQTTGRSAWIPADPDDDKFVENALVGNAAVIVSGDQHLLKQGSIEGISVPSPRAFSQQLSNEAE